MPVYNRVAVLHAKKEQAEKRRISLSEAAREAGITRQTLGSWFSGNIDTFHADVVERLCRYYRCDIADLLTFRKEDAEGQQVALAAGKHR